MTTHWTDNIKTQKSELIATFTDKKAAKEVRRQLEIGAIYNSIGSLQGRIVQEGSSYKLFAIL